MFRGSDSSKVDDKGRWKMPASLVELLGDAKGSPFFITISADMTCGEIWPVAEWQKVEANLAKASVLNKTVRGYRNLVGYYGRQEPLDGAGRLMLPKRLREKLKLEGEVLAVGQDRFIALYNEARFEADMLPPDGLTDGEIDELMTLTTNPGNQ